jgi:hypothetical protein
MILIFGARTYGRVDEVPEIFHVVTRFAHLWYLPLLPMESYLVLAVPGRERVAVKIGLSVRSYMTAWLRCGLVLFSLFLVAWLLVALVGPLRQQSGTAWIEPAIMLPVTISLLLWTLFGSFWRRASYTRAVRLAERAGAPPVIQIWIDRHFGTITDDEARELIELERKAVAEAHEEETADAGAPASGHDAPTAT